jgi:hypothetical protein
MTDGGAGTETATNPTAFDFTVHYFILADSSAPSARLARLYMKTSSAEILER